MFDPKRGVKFITYAYRCVWGMMAATAAKGKWRKNVPCDELLLDGIVDRHDHVEDAAENEVRDMLTAAKGRLSKRQRVIVEGYYTTGRTLSNIGREVRVGKERVRQIRNGALARLRSDRDVERIAR